MDVFLLHEGLLQKQILYQQKAYHFYGGGVFKEQTHYSPLHRGTVEVVDVVSVLEQNGVPEMLIATNFDGTFRVEGHSTSTNVMLVRAYLESTRATFVGRIKAKTDGVLYTQTLYVYRRGMLLYADVMRSLGTLIGGV